jgi:type VI secretion system protein ImpB
MDGKSGAEELIAKLINDPSLLQALASAPKPAASPADEPSTENASDGGE